MIALLGIAKTLWGFLSKLPWWLYVAIALVVYHFAAIHHYEGVARDECNAAWQKKEQAAQAAYDAEVAKLKAQNAAKEDTWQTRFTEIEVNNAEQQQAAQDQAARDVAAARAGALKLRVPGGCVQTGNSGSPQTATDTGKAEPPQSCELPPTITGNLYSEADRANGDVGDFNDCLALLRAERK